MADVQKLVKAISEEIARDLVVRRGQNISDTTIAIEVADAFQDLENLDADRFIALIKGYLKVADVSVHIPVWRLDDDGRVKSEDELKQELEAHF